MDFEETFEHFADLAALDLEAASTAATNGEVRRLCKALSLILHMISKLEDQFVSHASGLALTSQPDLAQPSNN